MEQIILNRSAHGEDSKNGIVELDTQQMIQDKQYCISVKRPDGKTMALLVTVKATSDE